MIKSSEYAEELVGELFQNRYQIQEELGTTAITQLFRGKDLSSGADVQIKIFSRSSRSPLFESYLAFQRQTKAIAQINQPRVARVLAMERTTSAVALVEEFFPGPPLSQFLHHFQFSPRAVLTILYQLVEALDPFHEIGFHHRRLSATNILLAGINADRAPQESWEIDSRILHFGHSLIADSTLTGDEPAEDFAYMAPERLGILPHLSDGRSDFYSLGVVSYRLLAGRLPFEGDNAAAYLHRVMATNPEPLRALRADVPAELESLISRLIAKIPEERPQSIPKLREELKRISSLEQSVDDSFDRKAARGLSLKVPALVEREGPLRRLRTQFSLASVGQGGVVLISGSNGDGKTRLVEELRSHVEASGGIFLRTQANELEKNLPFYAVRELLDEYIALVKKMPEGRRSEITGKIQTAVGSLGGELLRLVPAIRELLVSIPEIIPLDPERERHRFISTLINFFLGIGSTEQPFLIFFDDLHWVDAESRDIFEKLATRLSRTHILLVGAYRTEEEYTQVDFTNLLTSGRGAEMSGPDPLEPQASTLRPAAEHIQLNPLSFEGTTRLLKNILELDLESIQGIPEFIFERARGNIRFTLEIARLLVQDVELDRKGGPDLEMLSELVPTSGAGEIVLRRLDRLNPSDRELFSMAALIGRKFPLMLLLKITGLNEEGIRRTIQRGLIEQVIAPYSRENEDFLYFIDNTVQEDLYQRIEPERRRAIHEQIGDILHREGEDSENRIFEVAYHYLKSSNLLKAANAAVRAGDAAKRSYANLQAARFYEKALQSSRKGGVAIEQNRLLEDLGDAYALQGEYLAAERSYTEALGFGGDRLRQARLWGKIGDTYFRRGDNRQAASYLVKSLRSLGIHVPQRITLVIISIAWQLLVLLFQSVVPKPWIRLHRESEKALAREAVKMYHSLAYTYYFLDIVRTLDIHLRQLNLAERVGASKELAQTYSDHGVVCSCIPLHRRAQVYQSRGLSMRKELGDQWGVGQSHGFLGTTCYVRSEHDNGLEHLRESIRILERMGDEWEVQVGYFHISAIHRLKGSLAASLEAADTLFAITRDNNDQNFQAIARFCRAQVLCQRGDIELALENAERTFSLPLDNLTRAIALRVKAQVLIRYGVPDEALKAVEEGVAIIRRNHIRNEYVVENFVTLAEALTANSDRILALERKKRSGELRRVRKVLRKAIRLARRFPNSLGYALRVRGLYFWLCGRPRRALADFTRSREVLLRQGARYQMGRTQLEAGKWLIRIGDSRGEAFLDEAVRIFQEIGARRDMEEARELRLRGGSGGLIGADPFRGGLRDEHRRLASIFKISQTIASILELDRLLRRAVDLVIEVLGAERGFIYLVDEDDSKPTVRVARDVNQRDLAPADYQINTEVLERVHTEQKPQVTTEEFLLPAKNRSRKVRQLRSILCVPLRFKDRALGLIYVDNQLVQNLFQEQDVNLLATFAAQLAVAIENARAYLKIAELNIGLEEKVRERTEELLRAKMVLEKANLMKDEFLANMSHELRTPLNAVIALADILSEETFGPLNEKQKKYVGDIVQSGTHLLSLINDILDLSKIEAGQMQLQLSEFDLNKLLNDSLIMVKEKAAKHSIALVLDLDTTMPLVRADHRKVKQVVFNLLSNAVKFTEDGGKVAIRSRLGENEAVVMVEDTGIGISRENQGRIFSGFQQIDSSLSRKYPGTGLGLALSRRFVELHGGRIWVKSDVGKGSNFSFAIPLTPDAPHLEAGLEMASCSRSEEKGKGDSK